ncbi:MAG: NADH-quinone oxidoreductase subunit L [Chloroflexi bacterium]|nr:NADH-quinone oxidoreductase subunit L [Chloroflexota bacterium]
MPELAAWFILLLPLGAFVLNGFLVRPFLGPKAQVAGLITILAILGSLILSFWAFGDVRSGGALDFHPHEWMKVGPLTVELGLRVDGLTAIMLLVVTIVSLLVQIYSLGYMAGDPSFTRYYTYMALFTTSMLGLVMADNLLMMFVFWELVGTCSYLLIGFWYHKPSAARAAVKAFVVTRFGDLGFLIAILFAYKVVGTFNIDELEKAAAAGVLSGAALTWFTLGVFSGAVGKSAQFPLHTWLPDAMEGPTPVSALIHAATMVAAGVFLVARTFPIFEHSATALNLVASLGAVTAIMAASMGLVMNDIKRVMAYSTVSQLGFMMVALGMGSPVAAMFHLFTHAFFKGLLFLGSGSVSHAVGGTFDMRKMGGLRKYMPWTYITLLIAGLSLSGIFPLAGFWSKDEILNAAWHGHKAVFWVTIIAAFMTAFYIFRAIFLTFEGEYKGGGAPDPAPMMEGGHDDHVAHGHGEHGHGKPHESPAAMVLPLVVLAVGAIITGFVNPPGFDFLGIPAHWFGEFIVPDEHALEFNWSIAIASSIVAVAGIGLAYLVYGARVISAESLGRLFKPAYIVVSRKYFMDELYEGFLVRRVFYRGVTYVTSEFDRVVVDGVANLAGWTGRNTGRVLALLQTGQVQAYGAVVSLGLVLIVLAFAVRRWVG